VRIDHGIRHKDHPSADFGERGNDGRRVNELDEIEAYLGKTVGQSKADIIPADSDSGASISLREEILGTLVSAEYRHPGDFG
jgi:hypothetical protein